MIPITLVIFGGIIGIYLFSLLFRYAILGPNGKKLQQLWVVMLTGVVAIGFSAFGDGTDGFTNRITNLPNMASHPTNTFVKSGHQSRKDSF